MSGDIGKATVFVIDDDPAVRESLSWLMRSAGLQVEAYASAQEYLDRYDAGRPGCIILDVCMPGMDGLQLQEALVQRPVCPPIIIISGHGDVATAVGAMRGGALDFIEKPLRDEVLLDRVRLAIGRDVEMRQQQAERLAVAARMATLTPREQQIMELLVAGESTKEIAARLGLSAKTADVHRARILQKMQADSLVRLTRMVCGLGDSQEPPATP